MKYRKPPRLHLEIQSHRATHYGLIRSSFREGGKVKHTTHGRLTGMSLQQLKLVQAALRRDVVMKDSAAAFQVIESKEYGASCAVLQVAQDVQLDRALYSKPAEQWVKDCLAMIVGRVAYAGSKLSLSDRWQDSAMWELCGLQDAVDVDEHCYRAMDHLLQRQGAIQKSLAKKHLAEGSLVLYDITSSFFEGHYTDSDIVTFGYNRDGKREHEQMVIGLVCSAEGCPVGVEVFRSNRQDATTVQDKIAEVQSVYGIQEIVFVGDRGMVTQAAYERMKDRGGLHVISALTHRQIVQLLRRKVIQVNMFDDRDIVEVRDPLDIRRRYCLCRNPQSAARESRTRAELVEKTRSALEKIAQTTRTASPERIAERVGGVLGSTGLGKFVQWQIQDGHLQWSFDDEAVAAEQSLDGCYIIVTDVPAERLGTQGVVASYEKRSVVEQTFRNLKSVQLEVLPAYHKTDDRIRCHVFLCLLAYYLQWHLQQRLKPLFEADGKNKARQWTFDRVLERLKSIRRQVLQVQGVPCRVITTPEADQQRILDLLRVKL